MVAGQMSICVVDAFKIVQVRHKDPALRLVPGAPHFLQTPVVVELCQAVPQRQVLHAERQPPGALYLVGEPFGVILVGRLFHIRHGLMDMDHLPYPPDPLIQDGIPAAHIDIDRLVFLFPPDVQAAVHQAGVLREPALPAPQVLELERHRLPLLRLLHQRLMKGRAVEIEFVLSGADDGAVLIQPLEYGLKFSSVQGKVAFPERLCDLAKIHRLVFFHFRSPFGKIIAETAPLCKRRWDGPGPPLSVKTASPARRTPGRRFFGLAQGSAGPVTPGR